MKSGLNHILLLFVLLIFTVEPVSSQRTIPLGDSTLLYRKIEDYSHRNKFMRFAYGLIFKSYTVTPKKKKIIRETFERFQGKIIRQINIETLDPFGNSITRTTPSNLNTFSKVGDALHFRTQNVTISNLLLIHSKQRFDSLLVKESERLIRNRSYIRDVSFSVKAVSTLSDSVDVSIRVLDNWSLLPTIQVSPSSYTLDLTDQNFLGMGHTFLYGMSRDIPKGVNTFRTNYLIPNIWNTYVSAAMHYETDGFDNFNKSFIIDRPFYSTFTQWAGGVSLKDTKTTNAPLNFRVAAQDYWVGQAQHLNIGNSEENRLTNFITTTRYLRVRYLDKPTDQADPLHFYSDENFFLAGIGLSNRKYIQDKFLFKYGITEDVPIGKVYALTGGYQTKNGVNRTFLGVRYSEGNYYSWGYLSSNIEYETFFRGSSAQEGLFCAEVKYFTELFEVGKWKFRQFVKPEIMIGIHRFAYDSLTLNSGFGIDGFNSTILSGNSRFLLSLQTQSYAPWDFIGFRFGPFFTYTLGMLGTPADGFRKSNWYSQFGFGVLIKNENLILNTFQFSFSFFPVMPGNGNNILKMNSFKTTDFGFSNFEVGKPSVRAFQ
ncbi:MAG TPA: hypothetical protein VFP20_09390 [Bacteroidales bacterium]|nr:hypothetical protein [Bacteroidales bacterium]